MRTITIEKNLYTYDELSDTAKERARDDWNEFLWNDGEMHERMEQIAKDMAEEAGWSEFGGLEYSLYQQGGQPRFEARKTFTHKGTEYDVWRDRFGINVEAVEEYDEAPVEDGELAVYEIAREELYSLGQKMYAAMVEEDRYLTGDEACRETFEANGYEFYEDGSKA